MAQATFSGEEINRMKADAARRARQMQSKTAFKGTSASPPKENECSNKSSTLPKGNAAFPFSLPIARNVSSLISSLGLTSDQIIIIALILMLAQDKENLPLVIALLYIAM